MNFKTPKMPKTPNWYYYGFLLMCCQCLVCKGDPLKGANVTLARANEFPFVVSISLVNFKKMKSNEETHVCGGALITRKHVLTSEHCMVRIICLNHVIVKVGSNDLRNTRNYKVTSWKTYDAWAKKNKRHTNYTENDISIIQLAKKVRGDIQLGVITKAKNVDFFGKSAIILGWGDTNNGTKSRYLMTTDVNILGRRKCMSDMLKSGTIDKKEITPLRFLCTDSRPHVVLGCGDSGGPLIIKGNEIIGINDSICPTVEERNNPKQLNIHLGVDFYRDFIQDGIKMKSRWSLG